jgi:hypothetical protein
VGCRDSVVSDNTLSLTKHKSSDYHASMLLRHDIASSKKKRAALDSKASRHYFCISDATIFKDVRDSDIKPTVTFSNGHVIHSTHGGCLNLLTIKDEDLTEFSLLTVGQFYDAGCKAHFDVAKMWITSLNKATILAGKRDSETGLYFIDLDTARSNLVLVAPSQTAEFRG